MRNFYGEDETSVDVDQLAATNPGSAGAQSAATSEVDQIMVGSWEAVKYARAANHFMDPEAGLPVIQAQFNSHHNFHWIAGILANLQQSASKATCCTEWAREFGLPDPDILIDLTKAMETAYIQGMISDPTGATTDQMQLWYAEIITNREADEADIIEAIQEGQLPITRTEKEAADQANRWREMVNAGGTQRSLALAEAHINATTAQVMDNWEESVTPMGPKVMVKKHIALDQMMVPKKIDVSMLSKVNPFGAIEQAAITASKGSFLPLINWFQVAGGGIALYFFLEALAKVRQRQKEF